MAHDRSGADTREKILGVAETQFARKGYAGAHLQAIAEEVGVQKTALYYYFPSKAALYVAVFSRIVEDFDRCVSTAIERDLPHRERLECFVDDFNDLLAERPNYSLILLRIFVDSGDVDLSPIADGIRRSIATLLGFYREGVANGSFRKMSSRHLFQSLLGTVVFFYAARDFSQVMMGVDDIFARGMVAWRREEVRRLLLGGVLADAPPDPDPDSG
ncbi:MAG: TetR/AcrR family transcriptional regulator [Myxococcota bacterium]